MTEADLDKIMQMSSAAIIAPAGHGKTEMIAEIVKHAEGKQLLLTHTNAGVDAIEKRLQKYFFFVRYANIMLIFVGNNLFACNDIGTIL